MKFYKSKKLLNIDNNAKTIKGQKYKYKTAILYLAPAKISGFNVCPFADDCAKTCLNTAGRGQMSSVQKGRINKTLWFFNERETFIKQLIFEIYKFELHCKNNKFKPCVRLNGTSDIQWENKLYLDKTMFEHFPDIQFYDYTKIPTRKVSHINNYHLTWSYSEANDKYASLFDKIAYNIAVVFNGAFPIYFKGREVVDGDDTDLRFLDKDNVIVGLKAKGKARHDMSGFVIHI